MVDTEGYLLCLQVFGQPSSTSLVQGTHFVQDTTHRVRFIEGIFYKEKCRGLSMHMLETSTCDHRPLLNYSQKTVIRKLSIH